MYADLFTRVKQMGIIPIVTSVTMHIQPRHLGTAKIQPPKESEESLWT